MIRVSELLGIFLIKEACAYFQGGSERKHAPETLRLDRNAEHFQHFDDQPF
jgi:hypothetical protein